MNHCEILILNFIQVLVQFIVSVAVGLVCPQISLWQCLLLLQHISSRRHKDRVAGKPSKPKYSPYNKQQRSSLTVSVSLPPFLWLSIIIYFCLHSGFFSSMSLCFLSSSLLHVCSEGAGEACALTFIPLHSFCSTIFSAHPLSITPSILSVLFPPPHTHVLPPHTCDLYPPSPSGLFPPFHSLLPPSSTWTNQSEPRIDSLHAVLMSAEAGSHTSELWPLTCFLLPLRGHGRHRIKTAGIQTCNLPTKKVVNWLLPTRRGYVRLNNPEPGWTKKQNKK